MGERELNSTRLGQMTSDLGQAGEHVDEEREGGEGEGLVLCLFSRGSEQTVSMTSLRRETCRRDLYHRNLWQ